MIRRTRRSEPTVEGWRPPAWAALLLAALAIAATVFYAQNPVTRSAEGYARQVAAASAGAYITLRTLNAFLSTAQEVEVGGSLVVSGTARPLKVLEPIDDTIERIAGLIFGLMVAGGILAVAMAPAGAVGWALVACAGLLWLTRWGGALARRFFVYGILLGLAVPLAFLAASVAGDLLTDQVYEENRAVIAEITATVDAPVAEAESWWQGLQDRLGGIERYQTLAANLYDRADDLIASFIAILSVFVFKIFLLPAMVLVALWLVARRLA